MEENATVKLSITGKITYSDDITPTQAGQIIAFIDSTTSQSTVVPQVFNSPSGQGVITAATQTTGRSLSPREVLESSEAKTNAEKIVAFASLVLNEGGKDTFTAEDIRPLFRRARETAPANFSRDFDTAFKSGWIDESEVKGEYYLTQEALDAVEHGFTQVKKATPRKTRSSSKTSKTRKTLETPEVFKALDSIPSQLEGIAPRYAELGSVNDKFLWVLAFAKKNEIDGLNNSEVVWITDHLGAAILTGNVKRHYDAMQKKGYANRSVQTQNMRITEDGIKYLESLK